MSEQEILEMRDRLIQAQIKNKTEGIEDHPEFKPVVVEGSIVLTHPDERLRTICDPVSTEHFGKDYFKMFVTKMKYIMMTAKGIGLSAPQIGVTKRMFVAQNPTTGAVTCFINPQIEIVGEEKFGFREGCLSLPNVYGVVSRPKNIIVKYFDEDGVEKTMQADSLFSTVIQHEYDHLDGIEFFDKVSKYSKRKAIEKLQKSKAKLKRKEK